MTVKRGCVSVIVRAMAVFFRFFFLSYLTMAPQVLVRKNELLFTYQRIVIIFKSVEIEHTPSSFPQSNSWSVDVRFQSKIEREREKRGKLQLSSDVRQFMFLHSWWDHRSKNNNRRSRGNKLNKIAFSLTTESKDIARFFQYESSKPITPLGFLLRSYRSKSRSLLGRVEVMHPPLVQRSGLLLRWLLWHEYTGNLWKSLFETPYLLVVIKCKYTFHFILGNTL